MQTALHQLASVMVGEPLEEWAQKLRDSGNSWTDIAITLRVDHGVRVSPESLRRWCTENLPSAA